METSVSREFARLLSEASFIGGAARPAQYPPDTGREVAFAGRSNAGKSSALNALAARRGLARISRTPGRTQQINFFALDAQRRLVDLPGYGYAKAPRTESARWLENLTGYLGKRRSLVGLVLIMDVRRPFTPPDRRLFEWCAQAGLPVRVLLGKSDKLSHGPGRQTLRQAERLGNEIAGEIGTALPEPEGPAGFAIQLFSALRGEGVAEARAAIGAWLA